VFLTNALTGWDDPAQIKVNFPELREEHELARHVKRDARIIVVLGNPPYNRFAGAAIAEEADLVDHYKGIRRRPDRKGKARQAGESLLYTRWGIRKQLLDDLYIRFFRLAETRIGEKAEYGIVSFISNSSYLTGRSHPIMRESLLTNFHEIWIDNTHGNRIASERTPWGDSCETIFSFGTGFGNKVGTCITTFVAVWRYELGGYPVIKKWLGYRHAGRAAGRPLTLPDARHLRSMVQRLAALLVLQEQMDALYEKTAAEAFTAEDLGLRS